MKNSLPCLLGLMFGIATLKGEEPTLTALRTSEPVILDGRADDQIWKRAATEKRATVSGWLLMEDGAPDPGKRRASFAYDQEYLYVFYAAETEDPASLLSIGSTPEDGDCVRLEIGTSSLGVDCENVRLQILLPYLIPMKSVAIKTKSGWQVEMAIPWEHVGGAPGPNQSVPFNINANDSTVGRVTWAQVKDPRDFRNLGRLKLEPKD